MTYPKWVQRSPYVGAVLCANEAEETQLLADWEVKQAPASEEAQEESEEPKPRNKPGPKPKVT